MKDPAGWKKIEELFAAALLLKPSEQTAFLKERCGDDRALFEEVLSLLEIDSKPGPLDNPPTSTGVQSSQVIGALEAMQAPMPRPAPRFAAGEKLGPYQIVAQIGAGGMGEVYKARDTRLDRIVALKVSKDQFSERFAREAKAVAALNHPNICTLYDVGENFLVMEFIEGVPLKGPMAVEEALTYASQILEALEEAHEKGITHRDLKPANILVSKQGVKLLDFGLAKLSRNLSGTDATLPMTELGTVVGTLSYMAPEQIAGRPADARTDIYSFGCVLYEMLTGKRATQERNPVKPAALENVLQKCLTTDPADRWQSAAETRAALARASKRIHWIQGGNWMKIGVITAAACIIAAGVFFFRPRVTAAPLTDKDVLMLAEVTNTTGEAVFDGALREALAIQLEESPFLKILSDERIRQDLQLMGRPGPERLSNELAREICVREGEKAMIGGSIAGLGKSYAIMLQATNCQSGETLARQQAEAEDKEHVLRAVGIAATKLRAKLGESLASIEKLSRSSGERVTTPSLEAFNLYAAGRDRLRAGANRDALPLFKRAVDLDPNFAMAYYNLGALYGRLGDLTEARAAIAKAYALKDRVSEREKLLLQEAYFAIVTGEIEKRFETLQLFFRTYPREAQHNNLGVYYSLRGEFEKAAQEYQEGIQLVPGDAAGYVNLVTAYRSLDRFDEALAAAQKAFAQKIDADEIHVQLLILAFIQGDEAAAMKETARLSGTGHEFQSLVQQGIQVMRLGRRRETEALLRRTLELARERNLPGAATEVAQADLRVIFGDCEPLYKLGAAGVALCVDLSAFIQRGEAELRVRPNDSLLNGVALPVSRAGVELQRSQPGKALDLLQLTAPYERARPEVPYFRGLAYLELKRGAEAAAEFQRVLDHKGAYWGVYYPLAYLGLGQAAASANDLPRARKAYQDFFALWKDADPGIPVLAQAKKEFAALR
jgi:tetratricopeptide (TPR) repeat protein/predicted Ser/Thr protein kinase